MCHVPLERNKSISFYIDDIYSENNQIQLTRERNKSISFF